MRICLLLLLLPLCGCIQMNAEFIPPSGVIYSSVTAPLTLRFNNTAVTDNKVSEKKEFFQVPIRMGSILPSIGLNDDVAGDAILNRSRLAEVAYADYEYMSILGIYARTTINYYGR